MGDVCRVPLAARLRQRPQRVPDYRCWSELPSGTNNTAARINWITLGGIGPERAGPSTKGVMVLDVWAAVFRQINVVLGKFPSQIVHCREFLACHVPHLRQNL